MRAVRVLLILIVITGCSDKESGGIKYLNEVVDIMEKNSLNRKTIDWKTLRDNVMTSANGAGSDPDINRALKTALTGLNDHHSFITRGSLVILSENTLSCTGSSNGIVDKPSNIGYIKVHGYSGTEPLQFATNIQNQIKAQDSDDLIGWIVDLRGNTGGNMWPMIAGIGPILGEGVAGFFIDPDDNAKPYNYSGGRAMLNGVAITSVQDPYTLIKNSPKVAVLFDNQTASSGEATTVAFIGRLNTRSFGVSTCGLSTVNAGFDLSDGAKLQLTTAVTADRNRNKQGGQIAPDVIVPGDQEVVDKAVEWLLQE